MMENRPTVTIFYCYVDKDKDLQHKLEMHLSALRSQGLITLDGRQIDNKEEQDNSILEAIKRANIILPLISPDFINSGYSRSVEMSQAVERHKSGDAHVIPIILRPVHWQDTLFGECKVLPADGKPIDMDEELAIDEALSTIVRDIDSVVSKYLAREWRERGDTLLDLEKYEEAVAAYDEAIGFEPDLRPAYRGKAQALTQLAPSAHKELKRLTQQAFAQTKEVGGRRSLLQPALQASNDPFGLEPFLQGGVVMLGVASVSIDPTKVGVHANQGDTFTTSFGIYLPNITYAKGYQVLVRIIHGKDQFNIDISAKNFLLTFDDADPLGLWHATINLNDYKDSKSSFGTPGTYLYRYTLLRHTGKSVTWPVYNPATKDQFDLQADVVSLCITDPFAIATGIGKLSAFSISDLPSPPFPWTDKDFTVPPLDDLIVYELQVEEFAASFDGVVQHLDYLTSLGVNALVLTPITLEVFDWGYGPLHYFTPEYRWGGDTGLKHLVNACHQKGMAVILDVVYQHVDPDFAYNRAYKDSGETGPMGSFPDGWFGPRMTFPGFPFTQEYFRIVNQHWLEEYHVDGFLYDHVPGFFDGPTGQGYANLVYQTYQDSLTLPRFQDPQGFSRIIQCAEDLDDPPGILRQTYSNAAWQENLLNKVREMAKYQYVDQNFVNILNPYATSYPAARDFDGKQAPVAPFQYLNSQDHEHLITSFGVKPGIGGPGDLLFGDRANTPRLRPYVIALYTCQGIPMLWQGEELAENYTLPGGGNARVFTPRAMHWEYFYDQYGQELIRLYRILARLRRQIPPLRSREFYSIAVMPGIATIAYRRQTPATADIPQQTAVVILNFSNSDQGITIPFPKAGTYREMINNDVRPQPLEITVLNDGDTVQVTIPSNYGYVFVSPLST